MAAESHGGMQHEKREHSLTVYSSPFPNAAIVSGALSTSEDGEICLITEIGVHLLHEKTPFPDVQSPLKFSLGFLRNPANESAFDVDINSDMFCCHPTEFEESYTFVLDRSLNPNKANLAPPLFYKCAWSPLNCTADGSCLLGMLSSNNRVYSVKKEAYTNSYAIDLDFTEILYDHFKANCFQDQNMENTTVNQDALPILSSKFQEYKQRHHYLAITGIHWCPITFPFYLDVKEDKDIGNSSQKIRALLCGCNKLGMLIFWEIQINFLPESVVANFLTSIALSEEQATTVAWHQDATSPVGYIAAGFVSGHIKLCVVNTSTTKDSFEVKESQKIDLWLEDDLMQIGFMQWLKKRGNLYLVATKYSHIIVFELELDHLGNVSKHSYSLAPSIHDLPISALSCKRDDVLTTSEDGTTQLWHLGSDESTSIKSICEPGYSSFGMQLSKSGLMLFRLLCPTSIVYIQGKRPQDIELQGQLFTSLKAIADRMGDENCTADFEWYESCRVIANHMDVRPLLEASMSIDESSSVTQLQKKFFVKWLSLKREEKAESSGSYIESPDVYRIVRKKTLERINFAVNFMKNGDMVDEKSRILTLLAADWLIAKGENEEDLDQAISVFRLLKDETSVHRAEEVWRQRYRFNTDTASTKAGLESSATQTCMPVREVCPVCKSDIVLENETTGRCEKGHNWVRCSLTFLIVADLKCRKCAYCKKVASWKISENSKNETLYSKFVNVNNCPICNCRLLIYN